jgi:hypothetical protein
MSTALSHGRKKRTPGSYHSPKPERSPLGEFFGYIKNGTFFFWDEDKNSLGNFIWG